MMEKVRKISKRYYVRQMVACWLVLWMGFGLPLRVAMAIDNRLPSGEVVVPGGGGVGEFDRTSFTDQLHIRDVAHQTIIEWDSFNIGSEALTEFHQIGDINPAVLNRVTTGGASEIFGDLIANGRVFVINPAGIIFGSNSSVNVNQLVASSLDIANGDFRDGLPYTFTGGATAGDIIHESPTTITAEQIVLIGQQVINRGSLVADDYVIMAAGETVVLQADPGVSNIAVVVTMPEQTPGAYDYYVDNGEGPYDSGNGDIDADHVILAAGDIWSMAITGVETLRAEAKGNVVLGGDISAYSDGGSDAVADVTIITGGDFTANHEIMAVAEATGGLDNASASVLIDSDGNVIVNDLVKAEADAENGAGSATATVDIIAVGDVTINEISADEAVHADAWVDDSGDGTATLTVSAGDNVYIYDFIKAEAETFDGPSGNMSATVDIDAGDDVIVQDEVLARAYADDHSGNASATVNIDAGLDADDDVIVDESGEGYIYADAETYNYSGNATTLIDVGAGGDVTLDNSGYMDAYAYGDGDVGDASSTVDIEAGVDVTIDSDGYIYAEAYTYNDSGGDTALIDIDAGGDVTVISEGESGSGYIYAYAYNDDYLGDATATIDIDTVGSDVIVNDYGYIYAEAYTYDYAGNATALVDIDAGVDTSGNVIVDDWGQICAYAYGSGNVGDADADVDIDAGGNVTIENDGYIYADAETYNDSGGATADVDIDAGGDVTVVSEGQSGSGYIWAYAYNSDYLGDATATVDIEADNVTINDWGYIYADAYTYNYAGNATALVDIDAGVDTSGNVIVDDDGYIYAYAWGEGNVGNASGTVDIDAGGNVTIDNDGYLYADAYTYEHSGNATADVDIDAGGDVTVVSEGESGEGYLYAYAYADDHSGNADATVDIDTVGSDVAVNDSGYIYADAQAYNYAGNATALVDIDAGVDTAGNVTVEESSEIYAYTQTSNYSGNASADVDIEAGVDVDIDGDGVYADAYASSNSGDADTEVTVIAGQDITIDYDVYAHADTSNNSGDASATLTIDADRDFTATDKVKAKANSESESGNATALLDIDAGSNILLKDGAHSTKAKAYVDNAKGSSEGNATATVEVNAGGDLTIDGTDGQAELEAETDARHDSGDATGSITVVADNVYLYGSNYNAEIEVDAGAHSGSGDATGTIDITLTGSDVVVDGSEGSIEVDVTTYDNAGDAEATILIKDAENVTVSNDGDIEAEASTNDNTGNATALVDIDATGDVTVTTDDDDDGIEADADTHNDNDGEVAGNADATVDIVAGNVILNEYGDIMADADSGQNNGEGGNATATTKIDVGGGNVTLNEYGDIEALADSDSGVDGAGAVATVDIKAGNVTLNGSNNEIIAKAKADRNDQDGIEPGDATATTKIDVGSGNVTLYGNVEAEAYVKNYYGDVEGGDGPVAGDATAAVDIDAGNVTLEQYGDILAKATVKNDNRSDVVMTPFSGVAEALVDITTGVLLVKADGEIKAVTEIDNYSEGALYSGDAISTIDIDAAGDVTVEDDEGGKESGRILADADIDNWDDSKINEFTGNADADVYITALGMVTVDGEVKAVGDVYNKDRYEYGDELDYFPGDIYSGSAYANVTIDNILGDGVTVGPDGEIIADAEIIIDDYPDPRYEDNVYSGDADALVDIETCGDVIVDGLVGSGANIDIDDVNPENDEYSNDTYADVIVKAYGNVIVNSNNEVLNGDGSNGQILAEASNGEENSAAITVLAVGNVIVNDGSDAQGHESDSLDSQEEILAAAHGEEGSTNNAFVGIATREGDAGNVEVSGQIGARTWIEGEPGSSNTSNVEIYADQDLIVYGGNALIWFPEGPVVLNGEEGGQITAEASYGSFNTANVDIYTGRDVIVHGAELKFVEGPVRANGGGYYDGGQILALTYGSQGPKKDLDENTSSVGIYAQRDVTINEATIIGDPLDWEPPADPIEIDGQVLAGAHGLQSKNDADVVICAQDDVTVDGEIGAEAGVSIDPDNEHYADIVIAAGNVDGDPAGGITGTGWIYAEADPIALVAEAGILLRTPPAGNILIPITNDHFSVTDHDNPTGDGLPDIDQTGPVDCPECDFEAWDWIDWEWCEDCETPLFAIPIVQLDIPRILGCPLEMAAAALELGVAPETIQVSIGDALALNPTMQPCQACATLLDAAAILRDLDGSRMAAMNAVFNELAPSDAPFTPEMGASIVTAFAGAAEGSQYASVAEYIDAFVRYFATVEILGSPVEDSLAFVMEKYGTDITESENSNLAAFVATRLEAGETFAQ